MGSSNPSECTSWQPESPNTIFIDSGAHCTQLQPFKNLEKFNFEKKLLFCRRVSVSISLTSNQNFSTNFLPNWLKFSQCVRCGVCDRYGITLHVTHHTSHVTNNCKTVPDPLCDTILEMSLTQHYHGTVIHITRHITCNILHYTSHITCHKCHNYSKQSKFKYLN